MHGQPPPHNPLRDAAKETLAVAREAKSPLFEKVALITMMTSAAVTTVIGGLQAWHMLRRDLEKDRERDRRSAPAMPPPEPPGHGGKMLTGDDGDERRWSRREEQPESRHARQR